MSQTDPMSFLREGELRLSFQKKNPMQATREGRRGQGGDGVSQETSLMQEAKVRMEYAKR